MNKANFTLLIVVFSILVLLPAKGLAYFTTDQTATRLSKDTVLYTVTYEFGFQKREVYLPIGAIRGNGETNTSPYLTYTIFDNKKPTEVGKAAGFVFSTDPDVEIVDNQYHLPVNTAAKFTLFTLLTIPKETQDEKLDLSLQVTGLPFTMVQDGAKMPNHLNPSELQYYHTPVVEL